jgi:putative FmdB family regulatory protein
MIDEVLMPIYTYRCEHCGFRFDEQQSFDDQPLTRCPECGQKTLRKIFQPVGIVFKGSGFYATDHHSPSGQVKPAAEKPDSSESGSQAAKPAKSDPARE